MRCRVGSMTALCLALAVGVSEARTIGEPVPLGPHGLNAAMQANPEIAAYVARRGYPDWAEAIEVDDGPPLMPIEVHLYYLRLDKEIAFNQATLLDISDVGLRRYEYPLAPAKRAWIEQVYLAHDPARRAELAATRAANAAVRAECGAADAVDAAARAERYASRAARDFERRLRK